MIPITNIINKTNLKSYLKNFDIKYDAPIVHTVSTMAISNNLYLCTPSFGLPKINL